MKKIDRKKIDEEINLNLVPMMDLFVGLIPFLLIAAAFTKFGGVDVQAPSNTANQTHQEQKKPSDEVWFEVSVDQDKIEVQGFSKDFEKPLENLKAEFSVEKVAQFEAYLQGLASKNTKFGPVLFHATSPTTYEQGISVLTVIRSEKTIPDIVLAMGVTE